MARMKKAPKKIVKHRTFKILHNERKSESYIIFQDARCDPTQKSGLNLCFKVSSSYQVKRGDHIVLSPEPVFTDHLPTTSSQTSCSVDSATFNGDHLYSILIYLPPSSLCGRRHFVYYVMPDGKIIGRGSVGVNSDGEVYLSTEIPKAELTHTPELPTVTNNLVAAAVPPTPSAVNSEMVKIWSTNFCKEKPFLLNKSVDPTQTCCNHIQGGITLSPELVTSSPLRNVVTATDDVMALSVKDIVKKFEELRKQQKAESLDLETSRNQVAGLACFDQSLVSLLRSLGQTNPPQVYQQSNISEADLQVSQCDDILCKRLSYLTTYLKARDYLNSNQQADSKFTPPENSQPPSQYDTQRPDTSLLRMENEVLYNQVNLLSRRIELMQEKELEIGQMFISQISRLEAELREKNETLNLLRSLRPTTQESCAHADREAAEFCITKLEWSLAEKARELEEMSNLLDEVKGQRTLIHHNNSLSLARNDKFRKRKASTNTDTVQTKEQSISTCKNEVRPVVQKATSYAAPTGMEKIRSAEISKKKPTTLSERDMSEAKPVKVPDWVSLFKKVDSTPPPCPVSQSAEPECASRISESDSISDQSMGNAIRALFGESSLSSIDSLQTDKISAKDSDSVLECLCDLLGLGSEERLLAKSRWNSSIPATPCNSRSESKTEQRVVKPQSSLSTSSSLTIALRKLFAVDSNSTTSSSSTQSLTDLGEAMRRLFYTASMDQFGMAPKPSLFGTSDSSLADAMKLLFDSKSKGTIDSTDSLDSIPIWSLFDSESEGSITKEDTLHASSKTSATMPNANTPKRDAMFDVDKWLNSSKSNRRTSPHVSSIIGTSSPIRDANITYPKPKNVAFPPVSSTEVDNSSLALGRNARTHHRCVKPRSVRNCQRSFLHNKKCTERARKIKPTHHIHSERRNMATSHKDNLVNEE